MDNSFKNALLMKQCEEKYMSVKNTLINTKNKLSEKKYSNHILNKLCELVDKLYIRQMGKVTENTCVEICTKLLLTFDNILTRVHNMDNNEKSMFNMNNNEKTNCSAHSFDNKYSNMCPEKDANVGEYTSLTDKSSYNNETTSYSWNNDKYGVEFHFDDDRTADNKECTNNYAFVNNDVNKCCDCTAESDEDFLVETSELPEKITTFPKLIDNLVEHPNHYGANNGRLQCLEAMLIAFGKEATMNFCKLNSFKYIWRSSLKGTESQDMEKARRYEEYWNVMNKLPGNEDDGSLHDFLNKQ